MIRVWYSIRKPIGYILAAGIIYLVIIAMHAIPHLLTDWITGR